MINMIHLQSFNPRAREDATVAKPMSPTAGSSFNPRAREDATANVDRCCTPVLVSIHAPVRTRLAHNAAFDALVWFQSTRP